jgi:type IV secretion system protein VirD4
LRDWFTASDNTFTSIRQSVTAKINLWLNPYVDAATAESDFDLRSFREERISLYLGVSPDDLDRVAPIYNLLFQQLIDLNVRELPT